MSLYDLTKQVHHDAEQHPWGARMATGDITQADWADWLLAMQEIHVELDPHLPPELQRGGTLTLDLARTMSKAQPQPCIAASMLARSLSDPASIGGAAYTFCGAHLRGGAVIRKRLEPKGFACAHLRFTEAREANEWLVALRDAEALAQGAVVAFRGIVDIMDEIEARGHG